MEGKGLHGGEILEQTYKTLTDRFGEEEIFFRKKVEIIIAEDVEVHRTRNGYAAYERAYLCQFGGKVWALSIGERILKNDLTEGYDKDLVAISLDTENKCKPSWLKP